jgi:hypothetical protein
MRSGLVLGVALAWAAAARAEPEPSPRTWALVVGVNRYADAGFRALDYSGNDARLMHRVLTTRCHVPAEQVVRMTDDEADPRLQPVRQQVGEQVERLAGLARPGDTLVVFFSGHGVPDGQGTMVLATRDCVKADAARTGIPAAWLKKTLEACPATRKLLVLDCCHAGAARGPEDGPAVRLAPCFEHARGLVTLASCGPDELSHEWPDVRQGLFTHFLALGMQGGADLDGNGIVDVEELYKFLYNHVSETAVRVKGVRQHPQLYRAEGASGVLAVACLDSPDVPYPVRARVGSVCPRELMYTEQFTLHSGRAVWSQEYRETQRMKVEVRETDASGRPTHVATHFVEDIQETWGRLASGGRNRVQRGPWDGRTVLHEWRPGAPVVLFPETADSKNPNRPIPHPLALDEALLPDVRVRVGETTADSGRVAELLRQLAPQANVEFLAGPTVTLAGTEEGGRVLIFEGHARLVGCLATPGRTTFEGTWRVEYVPEECRIRAARVTAESLPVRRGDQEFRLIVNCQLTNTRP